MQRAPLLQQGLGLGIVSWSLPMQCRRTSRSMLQTPGRHCRPHGASGSMTLKVGWVKQMHSSGLMPVELHVLRLRSWLAFLKPDLFRQCWRSRGRSHGPCWSLKRCCTNLWLTWVSWWGRAFHHLGKRRLKNLKPLRKQKNAKDPRQLLQVQKTCA